MSCRLNGIAAFRDISRVKDFLFPQDEAPDITLDNWENNDWDTDWAQDEAEVIEESKNTPVALETWLQDCLISASPCVDVIALAVDDKIVVLTQSHESEDEDTEGAKLSIAWKGSPVQEENEMITSVMCVPLASQKRSSQGLPDWTCVIVGFSTGYLRMYTESGTLLLSQLLHEGPIIGLKCRSYEPPRFAGVSEQTEELTVLYKKALVTIDGFSLFQALRACRSHAARAAATGSEVLQSPPLAYKKWGLNNQDQISDQISCGTYTPNPFDRMSTASLLGGCDANIKSSPPAISVHVTTGDSPYVGFYHAVEGSVQPMLSDVAYAVAHKLKSKLLSAASGWLGFGKTADSNAGTENKKKIEPATSLGLRCGLPDKRRLGESIALSPNSKLAAVTDSFGRVMLIDLFKGQAIRMWKGHRDAQVGWVQVDEGSSHGQTLPQKRAMFLVIYAPRRGILEVWLSEQGPRVAVFSVDKNCQLMCPSYTMIGLNNTNYRGVTDQVIQCCLIDPQGLVHSIEIPFHLALSDTSNKKARDLHLLKKVRIIMKNNIQNPEAMLEELKIVINEMKSASVQQQVVEKVLQNKRLSLETRVAIVDYVLSKYHQQVEEQDIEKRMLRNYCCTQQKLIQAFKKICETKTTCTQTSEPQALQTLLNLTESEVTHLTNQLEIYDKIPPSPCVTFKDEFSLDVSEFLACFQHEEHTKDSDVSHVKLKASLTETEKSNLGFFLFERCLNGIGDCEELCKLLPEIGISPDSAIEMLANAWLNEKQCLYDFTKTEVLIYLVKHITHGKDMSEIIVPHNSISPWWQKIRDVCSRSLCTARALIMSVICRTVTIEMTAAFNKTMDGEEDMELSDWEAVSMDVEQWNLTIKRLEDLLVFNAVVSSKMPGRTTSDVSPLSVSSIVEGGIGILSEVLARWTCQNEVPLHVFLPSHQSDYNESQNTEFSEEKEKDSVSHISGLLEKLRHRFPYSLDPDILLSNCSWEYAVLWSRDIEVVENLSKAIYYLGLIQNGILTHGIAMMIYDMFISKKFMAAAALLQKVGKAPKERICRKELEMSDHTASKFLSVVCQFLQIMMEANCEANDIPVHQFEDSWQDAKGSTSLVELALNQKMSNYLLLQHHWTLSTVMFATMRFNMKSIKPMTLYDTKSRNAFFKDLHSHPYFENKMEDLKIIQEREKFLTRVLDHSLHGLHGSVQSADPGDVHTWTSRLSTLSDALHMDSDMLQQHHACALYSYGKDQLASEVSSSVVDHTVLGYRLLTIVGQRLSHYVLHGAANDSSQKVSKLPPDVSKWLRNKDSNELHVADVDLDKTSHLLEQVINMLPEGHAEYKIAIALVDLIQNFK